MREVVVADLWQFDYFLSAMNERREEKIVMEYIPHGNDFNLHTFLNYTCSTTPNGYDGNFVPILLCSFS